MRLRKHSWDLLQRIAGDVTGPWLVDGDFNEIVAKAIDFRVCHK